MDKHYFAMEKAAREYERNREPEAEKKIELGQIMAANIIMGALLVVALTSFLWENCRGRHLMLGIALY